ncbi:glycosyltransferase family 4 protein [Halobacillus locisalis]|uniref:Glycosyltransferase family 4 protein n=1 Tax=Halobacillus locisalis TaxID=220753 RepID=A0A838CX51_9BACI|nr:glycosyltransferase family 4 protein [Halobacillus locisalis]MBA2176345.1 glycosyltransferase family 4 protein [Halobacillus locisalis]
MNVLLLTDKLIFGGAESYYCKLENCLEHPDVECFTAAAPGELEGRLKYKERFLRLSRTNHAKNLWSLARFVKKKQIDLIHANSLRMVMYAALLKKYHPLTIVYTKHNVTSLEQQFPRIFAKLINAQVARVITVSDFEKRNMTAVGVTPEIVKTIHNGVDLKQFPYSKKVDHPIFKVGILGRVSEEKNQSFFVEIAAALRSCSNLDFQIAGDGPDTSRIKDKITQLGLEGRVQMVGMVEKPEEFVKEMDVLLMTSTREVFPMVVLEAMATGTPLISIDRGGIKEAILTDETGYLIRDHSLAEFSSKVLYLKSHQTIRDQISRRGRQRVEQHFSLERMIQKTLVEYLSLYGEVTKHEQKHHHFWRINRRRRNAKVAGGND